MDKLRKELNERSWGTNEWTKMKTSYKLYLPPVQHRPLYPVLQLHLPGSGVPRLEHPELQGRLSTSANGQDPPHVAARITFRWRLCVPPVPQGCVQGLHVVQLSTAQFVTGHLRLRLLLHPSVWSTITITARNRKDQSNLDIIFSSFTLNCLKKLKQITSW